MFVPECFKIEGLYFCKVAHKKKNPIESNWQNKTYTWKDVLNWSNNINVGLIGSENFVILDIDQEQAKMVLKKLPETIVTITGSGGIHAYYKTKKAYTVRINNDKGRVFDIQSTGTQALMPGSQHPNGNYYEIDRGDEIPFVEFNKLLKECSKFGTTSNSNSQKKSIHNFDKKLKKPAQATHKQNEYPFTISDVLSKLGFDAPAGEGLTDTPFGISNGKRCLHYNDFSGLWYDFHNNSETYSGTLRRLLYLLKKKNKLPEQFRGYI